MTKLIRDPNCTRCRLHQDAEYVCLLGQGPIPCDVMVIGEAPGHREDDSGKPFVGRSGQLLEQHLREYGGFDRSEVFITNAVSCRPKENRTPRPKEIAACRHWLNYQLSIVKPKYILLLGNIALQSMLGIKGIRKHRGRAVEIEGGTVILPTYHPSAILRDETNRLRGVFQEDIWSFKRIVDFGGIPRERNLRTIIVDTPAKFEQLCKSLVGVVSCDIETTGLYPWDKNAAVVTIGFGTLNGEYHLPVNHPESPWTQPNNIEEMLKCITERVDDCVLVFQNGKFDLLWLWVHYGVRWRNDFDTMLAHYLCDENSAHDLEYLAAIFHGAHKWDIPLKEKQGQASFATIAEYAGHDLYYTRKLYFNLRKKLAEDSKTKRIFERIMMPCANLYLEMEYNGCYLNLERMDDAEEYLRGELTAAERKLNKWGEINWGSTKQVAELLYGKLGIKCPQKTKKGAPSTSESTLNQIDHPIIPDIFKRRGAAQQLSFFIDGWKPYIEGRRIHPTSKLHGTVTGRLSYEHPNFQQVPRDKRIRSLVIAPPGYELLEADLSQIELRIVAEASGDPTLRHVFYNGLDAHWKTALEELSRGGGKKDLVIDTASTLAQRRMMYADAIEYLLSVGCDAAAQVNPEWDEIRKKAKAVNFGYVFGMWWKKFMIYARDNYDIHLTPIEAQESRRNFFDTYRLEPWHRRQREFASLNGFVRSYSGRKRRLPDAQLPFDSPERGEAWRQAINSPIQSFANELNLMVLLQMSEEFPDRRIFRPTLTVHDATLAEVRKDHVVQCATRMEEVMRHPKMLDEFEIKFSVPLEGKVKIGSWGSGVSLKQWIQTHVS